MTAFASRSSWSCRGRTLGATVLLATTLTTAGWAALAPITGAIVARGMFLVQGERQKVQHRDGGRIAKVHVALGDRVTTGDVLVTFDVPELEIKRRQLSETHTALGKKSALISDELEGVRKLYKAGLVAKPRYLAVERDLIQVESDLEDVRHKTEEVQSLLANAKLRAPHSGRIVELFYNAPGSVVRGGDKIMELLPADAKLVIDARVEPQQVHNIAPNAGVEVRLSGLNQKTTPTIRGHVVYVSPDALTEERSGAHYFQVRIEVAEADIARFKLGSGMPAEVMIETGRRSVLEYALRPLGDVLSRSMREPL